MGLELSDAMQTEPCVQIDEERDIFYIDRSRQATCGSSLPGSCSHLMKYWAISWSEQWISCRAFNVWLSLEDPLGNGLGGCGMSDVSLSSPWYTDLDEKNAPNRNLGPDITEDVLPDVQWMFGAAQTSSSHSGRMKSKACSVNIHSSLCGQA